MPSAAFWKSQEAFVEILGGTWRVVGASMVSYLVSQNWDVYIYHKVKDLTGDKYLWLRNIVSTVSSQLIDTVLFIGIAFYGKMPIVPLIVGQYVVKVGISAADTPFMYWLKKRGLHAR